MITCCIDLHTCKYPPSQYVALIKLPTLNFLNRNRSTQSLEVPRMFLNLYQHVIGRKRFKFVNSGDATSS